MKKQQDDLIHATLRAIAVFRTGTSHFEDLDIPANANACSRESSWLEPALTAGLALKIRADAELSEDDMSKLPTCWKCKILMDQAMEDAA